MVFPQTGEFSARFLLKLPVDFSNIPTYLLKVKWMFDSICWENMNYWNVLSYYFDVTALLLFKKLKMQFLNLVGLYFGNTALNILLFGILLYQIINIFVTLMDTVEDCVEYQYYLEFLVNNQIAPVILMVEADKLNMPLLNRDWKQILITKSECIGFYFVSFSYKKHWIEKKLQF